MAGSWGWSVGAHRGGGSGVVDWGRRAGFALGVHFVDLSCAVGLPSGMLADALQWLAALEIPPAVAGVLAAMILAAFVVRRLNELFFNPPKTWAEEEEYDRWIDGQL